MLGGDRLMNDLEINNNVFDSIKHVDEYGHEYWFAREIMSVLEYNKWQKFKDVIKKAIEACKGSNYMVSDHFT